MTSYYCPITESISIDDETRETCPVIGLLSNPSFLTLQNQHHLLIECIDTIHYNYYNDTIFEDREDKLKHVLLYILKK